MKKIVLTLALCALMATGVYAQGVSGGIKVGLNIANQKVDAGPLSISADPKVGFHVGGYLTAMLSDKIGVQPELLFSTMGSKTEFDGEESKTNLSYISLPILLRFNLGEVVNLHVGPQVGFLMSAKAEDVDIKDSMKGLDVGAAIGLGADFGKINAGARYYAGFSNTSEEDEDAGFDFETKNNAFQIYVGLKLFGE